MRERRSRGGVPLGAITAESHTEGGAIAIASLPTCQRWQLTNRELPQREWALECLMHQAIENYPT